ncbi:hypothetical protein SpCBS45565_g07370 [Spizellomyces sp. 'palustris']|nr:hypothetical protein SpCBS45565_g07370 [Spizellomyces sp. 'palustris']
MATIVRELWGAHPGFLKAPSKRNLLELIAHRPEGGAGLRVVPTIWYTKGWHDCYWTVTETKLKNDMAHGKVYGRLTWRGKEVEKNDQIRAALKHKWHIYEPPHELGTLEEKLGIPRDAPSA